MAVRDFVGVYMVLGHCVQVKVGMAGLAFREMVVKGSAHQTYH